MKNPIKIVAISGSLRKDSYNTKLLEIMKDLTPNNNEVKIYTLEEIPMYSADIEEEGIPEAVQKLAAEVKESDVILIATPEYNGTISGVLGNALDWLSRGSLDKPLQGKPLGVVGASTGQSGTIRAQQNLKSLGINLGMFPFSKPAIRVAHAQEKFDEEGNLIDDDVKK